MKLPNLLKLGKLEKTVLAIGVISIASLALNKSFENERRSTMKEASKECLCQCVDEEYISKYECLCEQDKEFTPYSAFPENGILRLYNDANNYSHFLGE